jgi:hypothetical protein
MPRKPKQKPRLLGLKRFLERYTPEGIFQPVRRRWRKLTGKMNTPPRKS